MQFLQQAQLDQMGDNRPYWEMNWQQLLERWTLAPIAFQLWFIRVLLIYNALYPFLRWVIQKGAGIWFLIIGFFWLVTANVYFLEGEGLFFFRNGTTGSKQNQDGYPYQLYGLSLCLLLWQKPSLLLSYRPLPPAVFGYYLSYTKQPYSQV
jgi:hypothetical protein